MLKKMSIIILALVLGLFSYQAFAVAMQKDDSTVEPQYTHIATMGGSFDVKNGTAICCGTGRSRYAETTTVTNCKSLPLTDLKCYPFCYWQTANRGSQRSRYAADMRFLDMRYKKHTRFRICSRAIISYVP